MSKLSDAIDSGKFALTSELTPPKGTNLKPLFDKADGMKGVIDAINITDCHTSLMTMGSMAVSHLLMDRGIEPVMQMTGRDRNRLAAQADLLGASALGIPNALFMSGDHPKGGDHPDAKPVFDLDGITLVKAASSLNAGHDLMGNDLNSPANLFIGAVVNPGAPDLDREIERMEEKIEAGAQFFQTQAVYEPRVFEKFMNRAQKHDVAIIAGIIMLRSARMARFFNDNIPGVSVPDELIRQMEDAHDRTATSVAMAGRIIREIRPMCQGAHIIAAGLEAEIPHVLDAAGVGGRV
jgi:5,10-methylenetetrahydrofolate reductase